MIRSYEDYMVELRAFCKEHNSCKECTYDSIDCDTKFIYDKMKKDISQIEDDLK